MDVLLFAALPWKRYLAQQGVRKYISSYLVLPHTNFGRPEIHSFQITSSYNCTLKNCIRPS